MDCQKDFHGNEHVAHTKCISEAEKYSAKGFVVKSTKNTNAKKQDSWINVVRSILDSSEYKMKERTREAFQKLQNHENVPRKRAKFENFATKCMRFPKPVVTDLWNILEQEIKKMDEERLKEMEAKKLALTNENKSKTADSNGANNDDEHSAEPAKKKKKKQNNEGDATPSEAAHSNGVKRANNDDEHFAEPAKKKKKKQNNEGDAAPSEAAQVAQNEDASEDFQWEEVLKKITKKKGNEGIELEKLKNKTQKKYKAKLGVDELTEKQQKKFAKKFTKHLKKCTDIVIENDVAKIA